MTETDTDAPASEAPKLFELTLPEAEAQLVRRLYGDADVVLEYGSGGSTFLAAELAKRKVFSVESDQAWSDEIAASIRHHQPTKKVFVHYVDVGPTREWGFPKNARSYPQFPDYPLSVWDHPEFEHPDVVLIDGRFRTACFLTVQFKITRPITLLWDDYGNRKYYHSIEQLVKPVEIVGRMARFDLSPMAIPADKLHWIVKSYTRVK